MLDQVKDWCFMNFMERPPVFKWLDERLERDNSKLSCSAFVFVSPSFAKNLKTTKLTQEHPKVVVGRPHIKSKFKKSPDKFEYLLCDGKSLSKAAGKKSATRLLRGERYSEPQ